VDQATKNGATPLTIASSYGHTKTVELLLQHGATVDQADNHNKTPLYWACVGHHRDGKYTDTVNVLLQHGANPDIADKNGATPYRISFNEDIQEALKKHGADWR